MLVKAYPQPSQKYEETVCCAGINAQGELLRLYPIRYRHLPPEKQFDRWDTLEFEATRPVDDPRPESRHVNEDTIAVVHRAKRASSDRHSAHWLPHVAPSLVALREANVATGCTLGIVKPDPGSIRFRKRKLSRESVEDAEFRRLFHQVSLIEESLPNLVVEYEFMYRFTSGGVSHDMKIHDWEVQAAYFAYKRKYGDQALAMLQKEYEEMIPQRNVHFVMGTMKAHPRQFIIIGLLRSALSPEEVSRQGSLL